MGAVSVDFVFECVDDNGLDLSGARGQEMDAFIGYLGPGETPPSVLRVCKDRTVRCAHTGKLYDPVLYGNEYNDAYPHVSGGPFRHSHIGVRVVNGKAVQVQVLPEDEDLPELETDYLLSSPANAERLRRSIDSLNAKGAE